MPAERIYLDHAATTPVHPDVLAAMLPMFGAIAYNPSSLHAEGREARAALDVARDTVARLLGAERREIVFTGSGSEANNLAVIGAARRLRERGRHLVVSAIEHHAVLRACDALRDEGFEVTIVPVDERGVVEPGAFAAALRPDTTLASVMYANNEIGTVQPIAQLASIARERGTLFHSDAVQAPGNLALDVRALGVDMLSISAHKFYGPKGVGVLYARAGVELEPIVHGGGQEFGRRSGTQNVAAIVGLARALELASDRWEARAAATAALRDRLETALLATIPGLAVNGRGAPRLPNNLSLIIPGLDSEQLLIGLDLEGLAVSAGSACTSGVLEPSHVIAAIGANSGRNSGVVRLSLGQATTAGQIDRVAALLPRIVERLRADAPGSA